MTLHVRCPKRGEFSWRPSKSTAWVEILLAFCVLGAAVELVWGEKIYDWMRLGQISRERASIIQSYHRNADMGLVSKAAESNCIEVYHPDKYSPQIVVRVRTHTGEILRYEALRPVGGSTTNWSFR